MKIDIICPLYNAENYLINLDKSLKKQKNVELNKILYILTESSDNSEKILKEMKVDYDLIKKNEFSHSLVRERKAFQSDADIIVFITQDIIIERDDWLFYLTKDIESGLADACFSRQICKNESIEKYTRESNYPNKSRIVSKEDIPQLGLNTFFFSDASSAIKREVFVNLNGYDGKDLVISEDMYIAYKLIVNGYKIKYCADSEVIHSHEFTLKQYYNRYKDTGKFFKENNYLNNYKVNKAGGNLAKYVLKRAIQDKNYKVLLKYIPNMAVRFIGMQVGKRTK